MDRTIPREVDCLILGGGITGAGVARDAAMRGLRILLTDCGDFAAGTSHVTSKLIHGGLRYMEYGHFRLVLEGVSERNRLLNQIAPTLAKPLRFLLPLENHNLPRRLMTVTGLQLYDLMGLYDGGRRSHTIGQSALKERYPFLRPHASGICFWDAQANDARLVLATLRTARDLGAHLMNYTSLVTARFEKAAWNVHLHHQRTGDTYAIRARSIINATGPWAPLTAEQLGARSHPLTWMKGTHAVLRRFEAFGSDAIVLRSVRDGRPLWAVPWENRILLGTTECRYNGDPGKSRPTRSEIEDLFASFCHYFPGLGAVPQDVLLAFSGVRPIISSDGIPDNGLSREHQIDTDPTRRLIHISGGKLTTFRRMAEQTIDELVTMLNLPATPRRVRHRLRSEPLWPGLIRSGGDDLQAELTQRARDTQLRTACIKHLIRHYGVDAAEIVTEMFHDRSTGAPLVEGLPYSLAEMAYVARHEDVLHLSDLVRRRTPLYFLADWRCLDVLPHIARHVAPILGWDVHRCRQEISAVETDFQADHQPVRDFIRRTIGADNVRSGAFAATPRRQHGARTTPPAPAADPTEHPGGSTDPVP